jgi:hypothetical protein
MLSDKIKDLEESLHESCDICYEVASSSQKKVDKMILRKHSSKFIPTLSSLWCYWSYSSSLLSS